MHPRKLAITAWLSLAAVTSPALGDEPKEEPPAAEGATSSGGIPEEARKHFAAGVALLQDPDGAKVEEAYREFKAAYDISGSPKILGNMGLCAMRLERDGEAIDAYSRYLREVPDIDPEERAQIVRDLETLTVGVARLTIEVNVPGARIVDVRIPVRGDRITNLYGPVTGKLQIGVRPGHHVITARLAGYEDAVWELEAYAGGRESHTLTLRRPAPVAVVPVRPAAPLAEQPESRGPGIAPWLLVGGGATMLAASAVTGIVALGKSSDIADRCPNDVCPASFDLEGQRSDAKTFVRITDVLLIGGAALTLGGVGWLLFASDGPARAGRRAPLPTASCGPSGCQAGWRGTF